MNSKLSTSLLEPVEYKIKNPTFTKNILKS